MLEREEVGRSTSYYLGVLFDRYRTLASGHVGSLQQRVKLTNMVALQMMPQPHRLDITFTAEKMCWLHNVLEHEKSAGTLQCAT